MKVCALCKFKEVCDDLPFFCMLLPYISIAGIIFMVFYFMMTSNI